MKQQDQHAIDEMFMMECLALAQRGAGSVSPNPMVGAVLVKNNRVIGRGYHHKFGGPHAEVYAARNAKTSVRGATLYVNLEPCSYYGKTPPCTDLVISSRISRVVVGMLDPNPRVSGRGISKLRRTGIEVESGVLEDECKKLNETFTKYIRTGLPFVTLKIAQTLDGKIADASGNSKWITNQESRRHVHQLRSRYDAVLVGVGTIQKDDPLLNVRHVKGRDPIRLILDGRFRIDPSAKICSANSEAVTIVLADQKHIKAQPRKRNILTKRGIELLGMKGGSTGTLSLHKVLSRLGKRGIASILVEGGSQTFSAFLQERIADKLLIYIAPKVLGKGIDAFQGLKPRMIGEESRLTNISVFSARDDLIVEGYVKR